MRKEATWLVMSAFWQSPGKLSLPIRISVVSRPCQEQGITGPGHEGSRSRCWLSRGVWLVDCKVQGAPWSVKAIRTGNEASELSLPSTCGSREQRSGIGKQKNVYQLEGREKKILRKGACTARQRACSRSLTHRNISNELHGLRARENEGVNVGAAPESHCSGCVGENRGIRRGNTTHVRAEVCDKAALFVNVKAGV